MFASPYSRASHESEQGMFWSSPASAIFKALSQQSSSLPTQWNPVPQSYPINTATDEPQNGYSSVSMAPVHATLHRTYDNSNNLNTQSQPQYPAYYNPPSNYPPSSPGNNQQVYPSMAPNMHYAQPYHPQTVPRPQSPVPQTGYPHAYSNPYSQSSSLSSPSMARSPQTQAYGFPSNELAEPHYEIPIPQTIGISSDYSASPSRPYSCDLCALSFNRQHDLKRHRETHTGEKPYLCNGGCGKTFTRKDALKRHQVWMIL